MKFDINSELPYLILDKYAEKLITQDEKKFKALRELINSKQYTAKHSGMSYRQINSLGAKNLFPDFRKSDKEWRTFSLKELTYLKIVSQLKHFGFLDSQLASLHTIFFSPKDKIKTDLALIAVFSGVRTVMVINSDFDVSLYSASAFDFMESFTFAFININFNEIAMEIWQRLGNSNIKYRDDYDLIYQIMIAQINEKELEILGAIRKKDYKTITIRKKGGGEYLVKGERVQEVKEGELLEMINKKDFADISITKRDGNVVNVKVEDNFKI